MTRRARPWKEREKLSNHSSFEHQHIIIERKFNHQLQFGGITLSVRLTSCLLRWDPSLWSFVIRVCNLEWMSGSRPRPNITKPTGWVQRTESFWREIVDPMMRRASIRDRQTTTSKFLAGKLFFHGLVHICLLNQWRAKWKYLPAWLRGLAVQLVQLPIQQLQVRASWYA